VTSSDGRTVVACDCRTCRDNAAGLGLAAPLRAEVPAGAAASAGVVSAILESPERYYVNVHTAEFRAGAVQGSLG